MFRYEQKRAVYQDVVEVSWREAIEDQICDAFCNICF
jgi:hypothetical protein